MDEQCAVTYVSASVSARHVTTTENNKERETLAGVPMRNHCVGTVLRQARQTQRQSAWCVVRLSTSSCLENSDFIGSIEDAQDLSDALSSRTVSPSQFCTEQADSPSLLNV